MAANLFDITDWLCDGSTRGLGLAAIGSGGAWGHIVVNGMTRQSRQREALVCVGHDAVGYA